MKHLKIESGKGHFSLDGIEWKAIDQITKESLLSIVNLILTCEVEMDEYCEGNIPNPAHQIIYKSIYEKLIDLQSNKMRFHDEAEQQFREAIEKYSVKT